MGVSLETLTQDNSEQLKGLQDKIGYSFTDIKLLQTSMIHSSFAFERLQNGTHNEILEFLGDAVLDLAVGYMLLIRFPEMREGKLTRIRSALVNEISLAKMAKEIDLGSFLLLGKGEDASRGREKSSILSCAYEAMVGAMFLDGGYDRTFSFVERYFGPLIEDQCDELLVVDAKSMLQEKLQEKYNEGPQYVVEKEEGPAHARIFSISVRFRDQVLGSGKASSKKEAEQQAASIALETIDDKIQMLDDK